LTDCQECDTGRRVVPVAGSRSVRVPRTHGAVLVHPCREQIAGLLNDNLAMRRLAADYDVQGQWLGDLSRQARGTLLSEARAYTTVYRDVELAGDEHGPILLAGHQPQLFHAGVWFKNFALSALAARHRAHAVNLLIDNDIHRGSSLRVPGDWPTGRGIHTLLFDRTTEAIPYEERQIVDPPTFGSFGDRVRCTLGGLVPDPLIGQLWPHALEASQRCSNLGHCLAEARHRMEAQVGQQTLELPFSRVCRTVWFARFATHLLAHLPRLQDVYNTALAEYRRLNRIRSRSHPVPDLAADGSWLEAPFWIWTSESPHRRRMFVRARGPVLEISDRCNVQFALDLEADRPADRAVQQWMDQAERGVKLRPRALVTTMYARLVLGDLFLHGIGGGKYDQLTDWIIGRFFGLRPPQYLMISATALLFEDRTEFLRERIRGLRQLMRELRFHPERHAVACEEAARLTHEKRACIVSQAPAGQGRVRHEAIERINAALQQHLTTSPQEAVARLEHLTAELRRETALASRDFSFCLFSRNFLCPLLLDLVRTAV
jgi:hypothetical protein